MISFFDKIKLNDMAYALKTLNEKTQVIARNIANHDTPFYKAQKLEFGEVMGAYYDDRNTPFYIKNEAYTGSPRYIEPASNFVRFQNNLSERQDHNDVNLDYEMSEQAGATILYSAISQLASGKITSLKEILRS